VNLFELILIFAVIASVTGGYRRGFWLSLAQYAGTVLGLVAGVRFAPEILDRFRVGDTFGRQIVTIVTIAVTCMIGGSAGFWVGGPLRQWLVTRRLLGALDSAGGAVLSGVVTLVTLWFLALTFARAPIPEIAGAIQQSLIITKLDAVAPVPPSFMAKVQQVLNGTFLPSAFAGLEPDVPSVTPPAASATTEGVRAASAVTVKVQGRGCGGISSGSGFPVANDLVITNAHVVAGTSRITVLSAGDSLPRPAAVVLFDPERDVALLRVSGLGLTPLMAASGGPGTAGAAIGYPGGGAEQISPALVQTRWDARGRDIYNDRIIEREIWIVAARVRPGNSGGPLVDEQGRYIGVIFARSVTDPGQAYALTSAEVAPDIQRAAAARGTIDTSRFACAA
jgi:S1-C subfamily serine protease